MPAVRHNLARRLPGVRRGMRVMTDALRHHLGAVVVGGLVLVLVAMVSIGSGFHPKTAPTLDGGAWLGSANGVVAHANGSSGRVDWVVDARPGLFDVIQQGPGGLISATQAARTIDPSKMSLGPAKQLGSGQPELAVGGGSAYIVYRSTGAIQPVDPTDLTLIGGALQTGGPIGSTTVDPQGVLYAVLSGSGTVVTVSGDHVEAQISGGSPTATLTLVGSSVVELDQRDRLVITYRADGSTSSAPLALPTDAKLVVPDEVPAAPMWVADNTDSSVVSVDPGHGVVRSIAVGAGAGSFSVPQAAADHVYLVDQAKGDVLTVDEKSGTTARQPVFTVGQVDLFVKDGLVWGNRFLGSTAFVTDGQGPLHIIVKYLPKKDKTGPVVRPVKRPVKPTLRRPAKRKVKRGVARRPTKKHPVKKTKVKPPKKKKGAKKPGPTTTLPTCPTDGASSSTTAPCQPASTTTTTCPSTTTTTTPTKDSSTTSSSTTTTDQSTTTTVAAPPCDTTTTSTTSTTSTTTTSTTSTTSTTTPDTSTTSSQP